MNSRSKTEAIITLKDAIEELESSKGSVLSGVQKLLRVSQTLDNEKIFIWCEIQLGNLKYTEPLKQYLIALQAFNQGKTITTEKDYKEALHKLEELRLISDDHYTVEELNVKLSKSGGGYVNIGFVEEKYADLVRRKTGNDGTYYKNNLYNHLNYVRKAAHHRATLLYSSIAFNDAPQTSFDVLKNQIDDKLLDINPELAEKLMTAFKGVSNNNSEEWSQALTTCRRFIENLADFLYPPRELQKNGRQLGQQQYINRIWAFMDEAIKSESNRELAKSHVDFLGAYLQKIHKLSNKGVHASLSRVEAIKTVFHTYLMVADILEYLDMDFSKEDNILNIHSASLDELQSFLDISKSAAKEIIKLRVQKGILSPNDLSNIKGIGTKTISKAEELFSFVAVD
jgi:tetratricopeptide (TPR) repeat protein